MQVNEETKKNRRNTQTGDCIKDAGRTLKREREKKAVISSVFSISYTLIREWITTEGGIQVEDEAVPITDLADRYDLLKMKNRSRKRSGKVVPGRIELPSNP